MASLIAQLVKNLPVMGKTWVRSLGQEGTLEKEWLTHSRNSCLENSMGRRWDGMGIPWKEGYKKPRPHIKKQRHHFADKAIAFPVVMYR